MTNLLDVDQVMPEHRGGTVILLDLNYTFVANSQSKNGGPPRSYASKIRNEETYRTWLLPLFEREDCNVHLVTIRRDYYRDDTLRRIGAMTGGWQPDAVHFSTRSDYNAPAWKREVLRFTIRPHYPDGVKFLALESNVETRKMYVAEGVPCRKILATDDASPWSSLPEGELDHRATPPATRRLFS